MFNKHNFCKELTFFQCRKCYFIKNQVKGNFVICGNLILTFHFMYKLPHYNDNFYLKIEEINLGVEIEQDVKGCFVLCHSQG